MRPSPLPLSPWWEREKGEVASLLGEDKRRGASSSEREKGREGFINAECGVTSKPELLS